MASVLATKGWYITVWYLSPFPLEEKGAFPLEVAGRREQKCGAGEKVADLHWGDPKVPDSQVKPRAANSQRACPRLFFCV